MQNNEPLRFVKVADLNLHSIWTTMDNCAVVCFQTNWSPHRTCLLLHTRIEFVNCCVLLLLRIY